MHAALPLRVVTRTDGDGQPQVRLEVDPEPTDRTIQRQSQLQNRAL